MAGVADVILNISDFAMSAMAGVVFGHKKSPLYLVNFHIILIRNLFFSITVIEIIALVRYILIVFFYIYLF